MNIKRFFQMLPRPAKACLYVALLFVLAIVFFVATNCSPLTLRQDFRRAEKVNLVGPSKIVDHLTLQAVREETNNDRIKQSDYNFNDLIIGETEYGICIFARHTTEKRQIYNLFYDIHTRKFSYHEKTGDITVIATSALRSFNRTMDDYAYILPLYIFTEHKNAVSAQITLSVICSTTSKYDDETKHHSGVFSANAKILDAGMLRCFLESNDSNTGYALNVLGAYYMEYSPSRFEMIEMEEILCTVALYDAEGKLIAQEEIDLFSGGGK